MRLSPSLLAVSSFFTLYTLRIDATRRRPSPPRPRRVGPARISVSLALWSISRELQNGVSRTSRVPRGHRTPPAFSTPPPPRLMGPYTPFYTILFYLPPPCRRLRSLGAQFKRASLVPSRHLFTNTSHGLLPSPPRATVASLHPSSLSPLPSSSLLSSRLVASRLVSSRLASSGFHA